MSIVRTKKRKTKNIKHQHLLRAQIKQNHNKLRKQVNNDILLIA